MSDIPHRECIVVAWTKQKFHTHLLLRLVQAYRHIEL
jgi:hypothetical protein